MKRRSWPWVAPLNPCRHAENSFARHRSAVPCNVPHSHRYWLQHAMHGLGPLEYAGEPRPSVFPDLRATAVFRTDYRCRRYDPLSRRTSDGLFVQQSWIDLVASLVTCFRKRFGSAVAELRTGSSHRLRLKLDQVEARLPSAWRPRLCISSLKSDREKIF